MNHVAFTVPFDKVWTGFAARIFSVTSILTQFLLDSPCPLLQKLKEYRKRLAKAGVVVSPMLYHSDGPEQFTPKPDEKTSFASFYFFGPDGEYLELAAQVRSLPLFTSASHALHAHYVVAVVLWAAFSRDRR